MRNSEIYFDSTSLAYDGQAVFDEVQRPMITVTSRRQALEKRERIRRQRAFTACAGAVVIAADMLILGVIFMIGRLIALQTLSFAASGVYLVAMSFFMLTFLESLSKSKSSGIIEAMAHIWRVMTVFLTAGLIGISATMFPDAGGSIILTAYAGIVVHKILS